MWLTENTRRKNDAKNRHLGTIPQFCRAISLQLRHVSTIGKKLVKQQYLLHMSRNMVNFGLLVAEIVSGVWGNGFRALAALLHGCQVVSVSETCGVEQRAPPMFDRATIRLGIGPHSSI